MANSTDLILEIEDKIKFGEHLKNQLDTVKQIDGIVKLRRKVCQEIGFLVKLKTSRNIKKEQLCCSNLTHLAALVECALRPGVDAVCKNFHITENSKLSIDIVSNNGHTWTKVIARNPKSLSALSCGNASYGSRSILDQAKDYKKCADLYPCMYSPPQVIFEFKNGIEETLAGKLKNIGVEVMGEILSTCDLTIDDDQSSTSIEENLTPTTKLSCDPENQFDDTNNHHTNIDTLNLDVTTMMAYVSNMTNGYCNFIFKQQVLTQQAFWESLRPVKPILNKLFSDKKLICCQTAWDHFEKIVIILGGSNEKHRTDDLKSMVTVLPDNTGGEDDFPRSNLKVRGHVRIRSKIIFNFGHRMKALTVSANEGFLRAAKQQGISYAAFIHESRALTEGKESTATKISRS